MIPDDIRPVFWGMGYLALGFMLYEWLGLLWTTIIFIVVGIVGMFVGIRLMLLTKN